MRILAIVILLSFILTQNALAEERLTVASFQESSSPSGRALASFSENMSACTKGSFNIEVFADGVLGSPFEVARAVEQRADRLGAGAFVEFAIV
ncbi:MAG: hypothetical protein R8G60_08545 [Roseovarius pacificus]|nr:hypothetical protein [Roseovarius pacificus]